MPLIPIIIAGAGVFLVVQADDALEALNPFNPSGEGFSLTRAALLGLAGVGAWTLWQKVR